MSSSKKGKKNKGKTLTLVDFLQETPGAAPILPLRKSTASWANDDPGFDIHESRLAKTVVLPTAPKAARDYNDINSTLPKNPPYKASLTNLPYDVDEDEIQLLFEGLKIVSMRFPKDDRSGEMSKLRGYGYVEFEDRESLLGALMLEDTTIKNRRIRIEVMTEQDKRRAGRMDTNRDRFSRDSSDVGDWRSGPRSHENVDTSERRPFSRDHDRDRNREVDMTAWRDGDRRQKRDSDRGFSRGGGFDRFKDDREDSNRSSERVFDRSSNPNYGSLRSNATNLRESMMPAAESPQGAKAEPRNRPKIILAPRTKPLNSVLEQSAPSTSIFGDAKPVDTSIRERQIEEKLKKSYVSSNEPHKYNNADECDSNVKSENIMTATEDNLETNAKHNVDETSSSNDCSKLDTSKLNDEKREMIETDDNNLPIDEPVNFVASNKFAFLETDEDTSE